MRFVAPLVRPVVVHTHIAEPGWRDDPDILGLTMCGDPMWAQEWWTEVERGRLCAECAMAAGMVETVELP